MSKRLLLIAWLVAVVATSGGAVAQSGKCRLQKIVDWPVRIVRSHIIVDGAINGQKIGIILDTGAQSSLILRSAAIRLDLPTRDAPGRRMYGVGGESRVQIATVDDFRLGEASTKGMQFLVAGEGFRGGGDVLLGEDFLQRFDIEFDLAQQAVRLYQPKNCDGVSLAYWTKEVPGEVEIEAIDERRPRINLIVQVNDRAVGAFLDSGAATSIISLQDAAAVGVTPDTPGVINATPVQGLGATSVPVWSGAFTSFAIGNENIPDIRIRFADLFRDSTYSETGSRVTRRAFQSQPMVLGADFLRSHRTLVSHSQRRLYFTYVGGPVFLAERPPPAGGNPKGSDPKGVNPKGGDPGSK